MTFSEETNEEWTVARLQDELFLSLMKVKVQFCMLVGLTKEVRAQDPKNHGSGVIRRLYEEQARYKMYRMPIFQPPPPFVIHLKDLDAKVKEELLKENPMSRNDILKNVVDSIYEQIDSRYYLLTARRFVKVRLEE